jgi:hypothetical protein
MTDLKSNLLATLRSHTSFPVFSTKEIYAAGREVGMTYNQINTALMTDSNRIKRGLWNVEGGQVATAPPSAPQSVNLDSAETPTKMNLAQSSVTSVSSDEVYVPTVCPTYIPWGEHRNVKKVIKSVLR